CRPRADCPALCRRRRPETVERDLIGAWLLPRLGSVRSPVAPNGGGGDLHDRDRTGRPQTDRHCCGDGRGGQVAWWGDDPRRQRPAAWLGLETRRRAVVGGRGLSPADRLAGAAAARAG